MSKGGSSSQTTEIPAWLENAAIQNINRANDVSQIGYTPYYGPDVAAFSPMQQQSMQSTGNAASAFGLAPQGYDAMAGMPQAQTFANGMQGYSSAPLYQESVDQLQANRPAQFQAMADMFIDPITGAPAKNNYQASPAQVQQMFSNNGGGGGGISPNGGGGNSSGNNDGEYFGVNSQYNPYGYSTPTENISGEKDRLADYRDMSFGEGGRRDIGFGENVGNFIKNITPMGAIERGIDYGQGLADGFTPSPSNGLLSQTSGPSMTQAEAVNQMNQASDRYEAKKREERQSLLDNLSFGGSNNSPFSSANTPTTQVEPLAATNAGYRGPTGLLNKLPADLPISQAASFVKPDINFPMGLEEDLRQVAKTTPLPPVVIKKKKVKAKKIVSNSGSKDREPDNWSPPKNNGYAGQSGKKSTKGKAKTGYSFGL